MLLLETFDYPPACVCAGWIKDSTARGVCLPINDYMASSVEQAQVAAEQPGQKRGMGSRSSSMNSLSVYPVTAVLGAAPGTFSIAESDNALLARQKSSQTDHSFKNSAATLHVDELNASLCAAGPRHKETNASSSEEVAKPSPKGVPRFFEGYSFFLSPKLFDKVTPRLSRACARIHTQQSRATA